MQKLDDFYFSIRPFTLPTTADRSASLITPKPDYPQGRQHLLPPFIFLFLQVVDIAINLNNQRGFMTVKVHDESLNACCLRKRTPSFFARTSCHSSFSAGVISRRSSLARSSFSLVTR